MIILTTFLTLGVSNQTLFFTSSMGGYLEARTTDPNNRQLTPWKPVCGGSQWTNKEALVACNQLRYHNTTTIGKYIHEAILYVGIFNVLIQLLLVASVHPFHMK